MVYFLFPFSLLLDIYTVFLKDSLESFNGKIQNGKFEVEELPLNMTSTCLSMCLKGDLKFLFSVQFSPFCPTWEICLRHSKNTLQTLACRRKKCKSGNDKR